MSSKFQAVAELVVAAAFWGFGFIATVWAMSALNAFEVTFLRFFVAALVGAVALKLFVKQVAWRHALKISFWPGVLLAGTLILQTWGLHYTTVSKSGFITTLYVIFVPLLESALSRRRLPLLLWFCVATALFGTALIVNVGVTDVNFGDFLTLLCAIFAAGQIYVIGRISSRISQPFVFNISQAGWAAVVSAPVLATSNFWRELSEWQAWPWQAWVGLASLAFGSTVLAFYLQVRAQARLSPTVSSLIFLLESPFAMLFAMAILSERLGLREAMGAALILLAAILASVVEARRQAIQKL